MIEVRFDTSGTTGISKKVVHNLDSMIDNVRVFNKMFGINSSTRMYHCVPRQYMFGFHNTILSPVIAQGKVVFADTFSASTAISFWDKAIESRCDVMWINPTIASALIRLSRNADESKEKARFFEQIFCGTAKLTQEIRKDWFDTFGVPLQASYGTSELLLISAQTKDDAWELKDNVGVLLDGISAQVRDGEIVVDTPYGGYYELPDGTRSELPKTEDGLFRTKDAGNIVDGRINIFGRADDIIIRGGINIDPSSIEKVAKSVDGIKDAAAVGVKDDFWGYVIYLFIESESDKCDIVKSACEASLNKIQIPSKIILVSDLPRTETGKVKRAQLRDSVSL